MRQFLATDGIRLNDTFEKTVEVVEGSGFIREGDEFNTYSQFNAAYGEMAGVVFNNRQQIENFLARIGLMFIEQDDTKTITRVGDEVGNVLYDFYLANDEPAITTFTATWRDKSRENINQFLRDKPWTEVESRLRYSDYGFSNATASALFCAIPETQLFETTEADFEVNLPEGCLWTVDRAYKVVGNAQPKRADITCLCGKKVGMYRVSDLENGRLSCRSCAKRTTDFVAFYQSISDEKYTIVRDFEDARPTSMSRITLQCPDSSHQPYSTYQERWINRGQRCPACSAFRVGEKKAREFLQSKNIQFSEQVQFDGLTGIGNRQLSYDFMINLNGEPILIEIDGSGHFAPTTFGGRDIESSQKAYQQQIKHDQLKDDFAVQNDLRLVRIQNTNSDYDFILNALDELLSGSMRNHFGNLYQERG